MQCLRYEDLPLINPDRFVARCRSPDIRESHPLFQFLPSASAKSIKANEDE